MAGNAEEVPRDIAKLWTWAREAAARLEGELARILDALFGRDGTNGLNGRTKVLEAKLGELEVEVREAIAWGERVWELERPASCIGKAALEEYIKSKKRESDEVKKARIALYGALGAALIAAASAVAVAQTNRQTQIEIALISRVIADQGRQAEQAPELVPVEGSTEAAPRR